MKQFTTLSEAYTGMYDDTTEPQVELSEGSQDDAYYQEHMKDSRAVSLFMEQFIAGGGPLTPQQEEFMSTYYSEQKRKEKDLADMMADQYEEDI